MREKLKLVSEDLHEYSLVTGKMFREDVAKAGDTLSAGNWWLPRSTS